MFNQSYIFYRVFWKPIWFLTKIFLIVTFYHESIRVWDKGFHFMAVCYGLTCLLIVVLQVRKLFKYLETLP